jgi:hypothetical protein
MKNPEESIQYQWDKAFSCLERPGRSVRLVPLKSGRFDLRVDLPNGEKRIFPVEWCKEPVTADAWENHEHLDPETVILSPVISNRQARFYREELEANHADLNGRLFLCSGSLWIERDPVFRHKASDFGFERSEESLFSPKATRVVRQLLANPGRIWLQGELADEAEISRGYVSRLLQELVDQKYVHKSGFGGRAGPAIYTLLDRDRLLEEWVSADRFDRRVRIHRFSTLDTNPEWVAGYVNDSLESTPHAFTQWYAAWRRRPTTTPPLVSVYVKQETLGWFEPGRPVPTGGNLHVLVPEDEGVFQCLQRVQKLQLVSDAQIYLDLIGMGQRGPDAAAALRSAEDFGRGEI